MMMIAETPQRRSGRSLQRDRRIFGPARLAARRPATSEEHYPGGRKEPEARHVQPRERDVARADHERHDDVAEPAGHQRNRHHPHHRRTVHRVHAVVRSGVRNFALLLKQLDANQFRERAGEDEEDQRGHHVLDPDDLVIDREDVLSDESLRLGMDVIGGALYRALYCSDGHYAIFFYFLPEADEVGHDVGDVEIADPVGWSLGIVPSGPDTRSEGSSAMSAGVGALPSTSLGCAGSSVSLPNPGPTISDRTARRRCGRRRTFARTALCPRRHCRR